MATAVDTRKVGAAPRPGPRRPAGPIHWLRRHIVQIVAGLVLFYMFLPIFVVVQFSFNRPVGKTNYDWHGFSLTPWKTVCSSGLCDPLGLSLKIGVLATIVSTILGTLVAFSLSRYRFAGRSAANLLIFLPMATPEVVMGSSLLTLFVNLTFIPQGFWTITMPPPETVPEMRPSVVTGEAGEPTLFCTCRLVICSAAGTLTLTFKAAVAEPPLLSAIV